MNTIKWFFTSKYKKLLYQIEVTKNNQQRLHLPNGVVLDFFPGREYDNCKNYASHIEYDSENFLRKYSDKIGQTMLMEVCDCFSGDVKVLAVGEDRIFIEIIDAVSCYPCQPDPLPGEKYWVGRWEIAAEIAPKVENSSGFTEDDSPW